MLLKGHTQQSVADILGVTRQAVGKWWKKIQGEGGWTSVKKQKRGRRRGEKRLLTSEQERGGSENDLRQDPRISSSSSMPFGRAKPCAS